MNHGRLIPLLLIALVLAACGGSSTAESPVFSQAEQASGGSAAAPAPPASGPVALESGGGPVVAPAADQSQQPQQPFERLVIKTADLSLQVASTREAETSVRALVAKLDGYVVTVQTSGSDENMSSTITFRVPAQRFDEALSGVQGLAQKVLSRNVSGEDVTEEFVDLESRVKNLEATRDRLLEFLDKANNVEEALAVNQSLSQVQGEIEQIKGRQQYLRQRAALSTITVALSPIPSPASIVAEDGWQPVAVARGALRELVEFGQGIATVAIVLLVWSPVWLPLLLLALWLRRRVVGRFAKRRAAPAAD
jgi:hypothetical protein